MRFSRKHSPPLPVAKTLQERTTSSFSGSWHPSSASRKALKPLSVKSTKVSLKIKYKGFLVVWWFKTPPHFRSWGHGFISLVGELRSHRSRDVAKNFFLRIKKKKK